MSRCIPCDGNGTVSDKHCNCMSINCPHDTYDAGACTACNGTGETKRDLCEYELAKARDLKARLEQLATKAVTS